MKITNIIFNIYIHNQFIKINKISNKHILVSSLMTTVMIYVNQLTGLVRRLGVRRCTGSPA